MNNTLKKVIKGTVAIFALKLMFISGMFIFQSCQTDNQESYSNEVSKTDFLASLKQTEINLNLISFNPKNSNGDGSMSREIQEATETICLQFSEEFLNENGEIDIQAVVDQVTSVTELIQVKQQYGLQLNPEYLDNDVGDNNDNADENEQECLAIIEIPIQPITDALLPATLAAKQFFYSKGFDDNDILEMLDGDDESNLIPIVMAVAYSQTPNQTSFNFASLIGQSAYSQDDSPIRDCFMEATGIAAGIQVINALSASVINKTLVKQLVKTAVKKIGGRALGGIGLALMVAEFAYCVSTY